MDLTRENLGVVLFFCFKEGGTAAYTHRRVCEVFGDDACSPATARRWFSEWRSGSVRITDLPHTARVRGDNYAAEIEEMVEEHPYSSARHIASTLGIDHRTVRRTLTAVLHRKHVCLKWVPHELTDAVRRKRVGDARDLLEHLQGLGPIQANRLITCDQSWVFVRNQPDGCWIPDGETIPTRERRTIGDEKVMLTVLFSSQRIWVVNVLPDGQTFDSAYIVDEILRTLDE